MRYKSPRIKNSKVAATNPTAAAAVSVLYCHSPFPLTQKVIAMKCRLNRQAFLYNDKDQMHQLLQQQLVHLWLLTNGPGCRLLDLGLTSMQ